MLSGGSREQPAIAGWVTLMPATTVIPTYSDDDLTYNEAPFTYLGATATGLWLFPSPQVVRQTRALEDQPILSLWTRVKRGIPSTILRKSDGVTWEEWSGAWPGTESPSVKYLFGARGFNTMGSDQSVFQPASRLYIGGHNYVIDDVLADELRDAVTSLAPTGYNAYIYPAPPGSVFTGDENMLSGFTSDTGRKLVST